MKKYFCDICGGEARNGPHDLQTGLSIKGKFFPMSIQFFKKYRVGSMQEEAHFCEDHRQHIFRDLEKLK